MDSWAAFCLEGLSPQGTIGQSHQVHKSPVPAPYLSTRGSKRGRKVKREVINLDRLPREGELRKLKGLWAGGWLGWVERNSLFSSYKTRVGGAEVGNDRQAC